MITPQINLAIQVVMGFALVTGAFLARRKHFRAHAACQSIVVIANLVPIILYMGPIFEKVALPAIPRGLKSGYYFTASLHAAVGTIAEVLGIYIILCAGTNLLPPKLRFTNFRRWMRAELCVWWLTILLGVSTFYMWNIAGGTSPTVNKQPPVSPVVSAAPVAASVEVEMTNFAFHPDVVNIPRGTVVKWKDVSGRHSVKADDGTFESQILATGEVFEHLFDHEGTYFYYCTVHGSAGGHDMAGKIVVTSVQGP